MRIGIDLGGTKIEGLVIGPPGPDDGDERARRRVATPTGGYDATLAAVAALVAQLAEESGAGPEAPVGVGIPGALSPATGLVKNANSTSLIGHALGNDLARATGRRVRLANDADCFTISEATDGAGAGHDVVFGVILGTGVGGGIAVGGKLLAGPNAIAGEWGHNPLPWPLPWPHALKGAPNGAEEDERPGPRCYCGKRGCIETFLSGPGLERDFERVTGQKLTAMEIVAAADAVGPGGTSGVSPAKMSGTSGVSPANKMAAVEAMQRYEHRLARALATVINVLDPGVIVLGGGMSNAKRLYRNVPKIWGEFVFSDTVATPLRPAKHGDSSGVRGAAWLWRE